MQNVCKLKACFESDAFCRLFLLNETTRFDQTAPFHSLLKKTTTILETMPFWTAPSSSSAGRVENKGEEDFLFFSVSLWLPSPWWLQKEADTTHFPCVKGAVEGRQHQPRLPPLFSYKYRGETEPKERLKKGRGENRREREKKRREKGGGRPKKEEERSKEENKKQRRERERKNSTAGHRKPPSPLPVTSSNSANDRTHCWSALLLLSPTSSPSLPTSTVHVACE